MQVIAAQFNRHVVGAVLPDIAILPRTCHRILDKRELSTIPSPYLQRMPQ
jgi:hypothetical protein